MPICGVRLHYGISEEPVFLHTWFQLWLLPFSGVDASLYQSLVMEELQWLLEFCIGCASSGIEDDLSMVSTAWMLAQDR